MKVNNSCSILTLLAITLLGCGGLGKLNTSSYYNKPESLLRNYSAFEITDFESYDENIPPILKTQIPSEVENKLIQSNIGFQSINYGPISNVPSNKTIIMLAEIVDIKSSTDVKFDKGFLCLFHGLPYRLGQKAGLAAASRSGH